MTEAKRHWYVVQAKPRQEERATAQFREHPRIEIYFPRIEVFVRRKGGRVKVIKPLFPGYFFARLLLPEEWKLTTFTRGVARVLGGWQTPLSVGEEIIEAIQERETRKDRLIQYYRFQPREGVYIRSGPLKDLYGIFDRYVDDRGRVRVLLSLVGYSAAVELEAEQIGKA